MLDACNNIIIPIPQNQTFMGTLAFSAMERAMIQFLETNAQMNYYYSLINKLLTKLINKKLLKLLIRWLSVYLFKEGHRGGFRNLLLDGWWLEFWEIILLAAGDVERNPGPRQMTGVWILIQSLLVQLIIVIECYLLQMISL